MIKKECIYCRIFYK